MCTGAENLFCRSPPQTQGRKADAEQLSLFRWIFINSYFFNKYSRIICYNQSENSNVFSQSPSLTIYLFHLILAVRLFGLHFFCPFFLRFMPQLWKTWWKRFEIREKIIIQNVKVHKNDKISTKTKPERSCENPIKIPFREQVCWKPCWNRG